MSHFVYILNCSDQKIYIGCTQDLNERLERHRKAQVPATINRLPIKLIFYCVFEDKYKAYDFERYLKTGSGRAFINRHIK